MKQPQVYHIITVSLTSVGCLRMESERMKCCKTIRRDSAKYRFFLDQARAYMETTAGIEIVGEGELTGNSFVLLSPTFSTF